MLPDRVSNPGPLTYESGALPIALRGPALWARVKLFVRLYLIVNPPIRTNVTYNFVYVSICLSTRSYIVCLCVRPSVKCKCKSACMRIFVADCTSTSILVYRFV